MPVPGIPDETWVVLMMKDKPNVLMGPFSCTLEAMQGVPDTDWTCYTLHNSLEEARVERDLETKISLVLPDVDEGDHDEDMCWRYQD